MTSRAVIGVGRARDCLVSPHPHFILICRVLTAYLAVCLCKSLLPGAKRVVGAGCCSTRCSRNLRAANVHTATRTVVAVS